jgi:hypothetical protein
MAEKKTLPKEKSRRSDAALETLLVGYICFGGDGDIFWLLRGGGE